MRQDGGDAETGAGVELGARVSYAGDVVTVEGAVRALVAHEASDYDEWGASGTVRIDPGSDGRGLSLSLSPVWGNAGSGTERLWGLNDARRLAPEGEFEPGRSLEAELGYGLKARPGVVTAFAGLGLSGDGARTWRLGARWALGPGVDLNLEGVRREAPTARPSALSVAASSGRAG